MAFDIEKTCSSCKEAKPLTEFNTSVRKGRTKVTVDGRCRSCHKQYMLDWHAANPDARYRYARAPQALKDRRRNNLKRAYGLTLEQYDAMWDAQSGLCAICTRPMVRNRADATDELCAHVDHNHVTGKIRALLCAACNLMLGKARDSAAVLRAGADYLDTHS